MIIHENEYTFTSNYFRDIFSDLIEALPKHAFYSGVTKRWDRSSTSCLGIKRSKNQD